MSLKQLIVSDVSKVILNTSDFAEVVQIYFAYVDSETEQAAERLFKASAIVDIDAENQNFESGEEIVTRGRLTFAAADVTKPQLLGQGTVKSNAVTNVRLVVRGSRYRFDHVSDAAHGAIAATIVSESPQHNTVTDLGGVQHQYG